MNKGLVVVPTPPPDGDAVSVLTRDEALTFLAVDSVEVSCLIFRAS
jgi:hypothetical protein